MNDSELEGAGELLGLLQQLEKVKAESKLGDWSSPIKAHHDFWESKKPKKGLIAGNRTGKTKALLFELTLHLTGRYPKWWKGYKFNKPIKAWLVGMAFASMRSSVQIDLLGEEGEEGTGFIPKDAIVKISTKPNTGGFAETIKIKSVFGGNSILRLWSSEQKRADFQAAEINIAAFDEEPPPDIHAEVIMRLATTMKNKEALAMYSFTPLSGQTEIYNNLRTDKNNDVYSISMDDVPWLDEETIESMLHGLSPAERNARRHGIAETGSGQIFQFEENQYACESFEIPKHWPRIGGLDIGKNHPTGAVALAWDRNANCIYVYQEYKKKDSNAPDTARHLRHWNTKFATSHDAFNHTYGRGESVADIFKDEGLECFTAGRDPWARIEKVRQLIGQGRLWIFKDRCPELMKEMRTYHTKEDGKTIYKIGEDVIDAFTHAVMFYEKATVGIKNDEELVVIEQPKPSPDGYY